MASNEEAFERLDGFVEREVGGGNGPGVAVALTDRDGLLRMATYGVADVGAGTPVEPGTLFEIGSIGKSFTAMALLRLREAGRVDLEAPVTRYLPWFEVGGGEAPITLHHLLRHTAGIVAGMDGTPDARSEVWALRETRVGGPPGERFHYSNVGYKALGLVVEAVTGEGYGAAIGQLLDDVGMEASEPIITHDVRRRLAVGYAPLYDDRPRHPSHPPVPATWLETDTGDGSIAATAADLATYLRVLLNRGATPRGRVLSEEGFALMTQPVGAGRDGGYGYGLTIRRDEGWTEIGHPGGMVGYWASMRGDLEGGVGAVALCNGPGDPFIVTRYALDLLRAVRAGRELPAAPEEHDPGRVPDAAAYAGRYATAVDGDAKRFAVAAVDGGLVLDHGASAVPLSRRWDGDFVVDLPAFDRFALRFGRDEAGRVVEAVHGGDWYAREGTAVAPAAEAPKEWAAYVGAYRAHNPWIPFFRVVVRRGELWLIFPAGEPDGFEEEQPLVPLGDGAFRVGEDEAGPERIRFDAVVEGRALRATLSGAAYWRSSIG